MKYLEIFERVPNADAISVFDYSVERVLSGCPRYGEFVERKLALRKELESEYRGKYSGNFSFRVYLENLVSYLNNGPILANLHPSFGEDSGKIQDDIKARILSLFSEFDDIEEKLAAHIWGSDNYINSTFSKVGLKPFFKKAEFKNLYYLKNGQVGLRLHFNLTPECQRIFEEKVIDDWGDYIAFFQDVYLEKDGEIIFSSITHEDWYSFNY